MVGSIDNYRVLLPGYVPLVRHYAFTIKVLATQVKYLPQFGYSPFLQEMFSVASSGFCLISIFLKNDF